MPKTLKAPSSAAVGGNILPLKEVFFNEMNSQAQSIVIKNLNITNFLPLDEGLVGDFPWFWNNAGTFNANTYSWLNRLFAYSNGYVATDGTEFTTAYFNMISSIIYSLTVADQSALNTANTNNATILNTVISDWVSAFGPIPATSNTTPVAKASYIISQVLTWGATGLTLDQLRNSTNPGSLLPNSPLGSAGFLTDLMQYLAATASVAHIQSAVNTFTNTLTQIQTNLQPAPATATPGWMKTVDDAGNNAIVPYLGINQSTATIQNALYPSGGTGNSFSVSLDVVKIDQHTVKVSASSGVGGSGWIGWFGINAGASTSYNSFSFDQNVQTCSIKITFNGVTKVTPVPASYDISSSTGWWDPQPIQSAANYNPANDSYKFALTPPYDFSLDGTFGMISNLIISQQPSFELTYTNANYSDFQSVFSAQTSWGVSFLGIPLGGGSSSYYQSELSQNTSANTVTVKMTPPVGPAPVPTLDQLAYVLGAQILWPGA